MKVGLAYPAFASYFKPYFPDLVPKVEPREVGNFDMIIFTGGEDINPALYHEENECSHVYSARDEMESAVFERARAMDKLIFGVCRGHQLINVLLGGSLYQDLSMAPSGPHPGQHMLKHIQMSNLLGVIPNVTNSMHHQGLKKVSQHLIVLSEYKGIPEVCLSRDGGIITVQFHPEFMSRTDVEPLFNYLKGDWLKNRDKSPSRSSRKAYETFIQSISSTPAPSFEEVIPLGASEFSEEYERQTRRHGHADLVRDGNGMITGIRVEQDQQTYYVSVEPPSFDPPEGNTNENNNSSDNGNF